MLLALRIGGRREAFATRACTHTCHWTSGAETAKGHRRRGGRQRSCHEANTGCHNDEARGGARV